MADTLWGTIERGVKEGRALEELETDVRQRFGRVCAAVVVDSTGFSWTTQTKGIVFFLMALSRLREIGRETFDQFGAFYRRMEADNMYADFQSVDMALEAAFHIHRRLEDENIMLSENRRFGACIGIGYGFMLESAREGMFGHEMNLASKLGEDTAQHGETLITEAAFLGLSDPDRVNFTRYTAEISGVEFAYFGVQPKISNPDRRPRPNLP